MISGTGDDDVDDDVSFDLIQHFVEQTIMFILL